MLCLVAVFAVVSCKAEPEQEEESKTEPTLISATEADVLAGTAFYRLTATVEAKRFALQYLDDEEHAFDPKEEDVLTLKYRTNHAVTCFFLRDSSGSAQYIPADKLTTGKKYHDISASDDPYVTGPDADGWYTLNFTFPTSGTGFRLELANYSSGKFKEGEYLDIKDLMFKGERLTIEEPDVDEDEFRSNHGIWNDGKDVDPDQTQPTLAIYHL